MLSAFYRLLMTHNGFDWNASHFSNRCEVGSTCRALFCISSWFFLLNTVAITIAFDIFSNTMHLSLSQILYSSIAMKSQPSQFQLQEWKQYGTVEPLVLATSYPGCSNSLQAQSKRKDPGYIVVVQKTWPEMTDILNILILC